MPCEIYVIQLVDFRLYLLIVSIQYAASLIV